ncbi:MAG TPA: hypothetical protein VFT67_15530 [Jatrophihabitantaceae bacterium]|nr:hypothetical protein [Jatrophihabitantaceae bacterium]
MESLTEVVTRTADAAELHAPVPTLLLELQSLLGLLTATVTDATDRGRRPFRPTPDWPDRFGDLAYAVYLLADQSGVDVDAAVRAAAANVQHRLQRGAQQAPSQADWPFGSE